MKYWVEYNDDGFCYGESAEDLKEAKEIQIEFYKNRIDGFDPKEEDWNHMIESFFAYIESWDCDTGEYWGGKDIISEVTDDELKEIGWVVIK